MGHALEALHYYQISHGQAILAGLMLEAKIGRCLDLVDPEFEAELSSLIQELPVPEIPQNLDSLLPFLDRDKKSRDSRLGFVFYRRPGVAAIPKTWVRYLSPAEFRGLVREAF